jgi:segregation and condensation protein B
MTLSPSAQLEALLFAEGGPLTKKQICGLLDLSSDALELAVDELVVALASRGLSVVQTETELELRTSPWAADTIRKLRESELARDLGKASLETLAIILYRGSATRSDIDWVRGVNSAAALRALSLRGLIERSEDESDKRRARYRATVDALAHLGVGKREDLPRYTELTSSIAEGEARRELAETDV